MFEEQRDFLKAHAWKKRLDIQSDQQKGLPMPPLQKAAPPQAKRIELAAPGTLVSGEMTVRQALSQRESRRKFAPQSLSFEELSFLLWSTQGVREVLKDDTITKRISPSGGSRQPFETYLVINRVDGIDPAVYRYLPLEHQLVLEFAEEGLAGKMAEACMRQMFIAESAVVFAWAAVPYRTEWRYTIGSHKVIALDAGHVCQNLYIAAESIHGACCAIAAYDQDAVDALLRLDGQDEFVVYLAAAGRQEGW